jgi:hypothetical protein
LSTGEQGAPRTSTCSTASIRYSSHIRVRARAHDRVVAGQSLAGDAQQAPDSENGACLAVWSASKRSTAASIYPPCAPSAQIVPPCFAIELDACSPPDARCCLLACRAGALSSAGGRRRGHLRFVQYLHRRSVAPMSLWSCSDVWHPEPSRRDQDRVLAATLVDELLDIRNKGRVADSAGGGAVRYSEGLTRYRASGSSTPRITLTPSSSTGTPSLLAAFATGSVRRICPGMAALTTLDATLTAPPR